MRRALLLGWGLLAGGCAWGPGQGFAVIEPTVRVAYESVAGRATGDGYERLASDYQVKVDEASLSLSGIALLASASGGGAFNPASPPPGYTLCHNGHCHSTSGALVPYEQIAAELGGGGGPSTVVALSTQEPFALLTPETRPLACEPDCALPEAQVSQSRWSVSSLRITGSVRDGRVPARFSGERRFDLNLALKAGATESAVAVIGGTLALASDRSTPPETRLAMALVLTAALFDPVDWQSLKSDTDGIVHIDADARSGNGNPEARALMLERLTQLTPQAEVTHGR